MHLTFAGGIDAPGVRGYTSPKCGVTHVTGVTNYFKYLYLLVFSDVTFDLHMNSEACNEPIWCNASDARMGSRRGEEGGSLLHAVCPLDAINGT